MTSDAQSGNAALCPACERFIGSGDVCPYCDSDSARPPVLRHLRLAALLLSFGGLAWLYVLAARSDLPLVRVSEITPMMNFAAVRLQGTVDSRPYRSQRGGQLDYVSFSLRDETGSLRVTAGGEVARELAAANGIPRRGDSVSVSGSLSVVAGGKLTLRLRDADGLQPVPDGNGAEGQP